MVLLVIIIALALYLLYAKRDFLQKMRLVPRILVVALYGDFLTVTLGLPLALALQGKSSINTDLFPSSLLGAIESIAGIFAFMIIGLIFAVPLVMLALPISLVFEKCIEKNPAIWSALAVLAGTLIASCYYYMNRSSEAEFLQILFSDSTFIVFWGLLMSSFIFCYIAPSKKSMLGE